MEIPQVFFVFPLEEGERGLRSAANTKPEENRGRGLKINFGKHLFKGIFVWSPGSNTQHKATNFYLKNLRHILMDHRQ